MSMEPRHDSVLVKESLAALAIAPADTVVDATLGGAGHFSKMLEKLGENGTIVGIDADPAAVERAREAYARDRRSTRPVAHLVNDNFRNLAHILARLNIPSIDAALFDLGWSGYQLSGGRGFSFQNDEPLLMTSGEGGATAAEIVNGSSEQELADLIYTYGEERSARRIARAIVAARAKARILSTGELTRVIESAVPRRGRIHPATKTFQALRIAANDEFAALADALSAALRALAPDGRLAVISFHSGEDRIVKNMLRDAALAGLGSASKKPATPSRAEIACNPRARSAKLRVFTRAAAPVAEGTSSYLFSYAR